jgi:hypothetical protein
MLTDAETRLLLAHALAYDARVSSGEANVAAWCEAARRARWTYAEALEAVHEHYATSTDWLMPGVITQRIRAARQDSAMRAAAIPAPPVDAIGQSRVAAITGGAFREIPSEPEQTPRVGALSRTCPFCQSKPGEHCTRRGLTGRVRATKPHPSRLEVVPS